jgi:hypothetical protein
MIAEAAGTLSAQLIAAEGARRNSFFSSDLLASIIPSRAPSRTGLGSVLSVNHP